jgi:hypothetical protein
MEKRIEQQPQRLLYRLVLLPAALTFQRTAK